MIFNFNVLFIKKKIILEILLISSLFFILIIVRNNVNNSAFLQAQREIIEKRKTLNSTSSNNSNSIIQDRHLYQNCLNQFKLIQLKHLNETYDDVIIQRHPNLPKFLTESVTVSSSIPNIPNIRWTGTVFQESWRDSPKFLLYSAHFDTRINSTLFIHILALYDGHKEQEVKDLTKYFCQIWYSKEDNPIILSVYDTILLDYLKFGPNRLNPFVISCEVTKPEKGIPIAVSLVKERCQTPTNILKITSSAVKKKEETINKNIRVGICGKALFYYNEDFSTRLIEWIEIMKVLGVSKIFLYNTKCHQKIEKILEFYEKEGTVKLITFYYPPPYDQEGTFLRLWSKTNKMAYRAAQNIYINDCLLRNKDNYDYLGVFDSDEIPILKKHRSLPEFLESTRKQSKKRPESYFLRWKTFFQDLKSQNQPLNETDPSYSFSHNIRTTLKTKSADIYETNGKTFHDVNQVTWSYPHKELSKNLKLTPKVKVTTLPREVAYMGHFSDHKCVKEENCFGNNTEAETGLLPFRDKVVREMKKVIDLLNL